MSRRPIIVLIVILALTGVVLVAAVLSRSTAPPPIDPVPRTFSLTDHDGRRLDLASLRGKPVLVLFGFTFCPDVCPTEMGSLAALMRTLGPDADRLSVVFISVDPKRDTPAKIKDFVQLFDRRIIGCTGSEAEVQAAATSFGAWFKRSDAKAQDPSWYLIDHSANTYLLDRAGRWVGTIDSRTPLSTAVDAVRRLL
jgi:protein SCO1/2